MSELFKTYNNEKQPCLLFSKPVNVSNFDNLDTFTSWLENNGLIIDKLINKTDSSKYDYFVPFYFTDGTKKISYSNKCGFNYSYIANNHTYNNEYLMFNYMDWCNWMDNNNGWDSYFTTDQCARGLNNLKSSQQSIYSFEAEPNQKNFFNLFLYSEGTSYLYNYKVKPYMLNSNADYSVYVEGIKSGNNYSTDLSVSSLNPTTFTLGFEAVISASNLDDYIYRATQQGSDTYPYWKRFLAIGIKGGFGDSRYNLAQSSFVKICSFDNSTDQFKLTYKKIKNNVYYIKDENYKTYTLPMKYINPYVVKSVVQYGTTYYYNGSPYTYDNNAWTSDIEHATQFNTPDAADTVVNGAEAAGTHGSVSRVEYITDPTIRNHYETKLSIPVMMPCGNISRNTAALYYIVGTYNNETYAYKGPLNASQFTPGDNNWTNKHFIIVDDPHAEQYNYLKINGSTTSWTPYIDQATYFSRSEIDDINAGDILKRYAVYNSHPNPSNPWHEGYWLANPTDTPYSGSFIRNVTIDSDSTTKYNTTAEAQAVINYLMSVKPSDVTLNLSIESTIYPRLELDLLYYMSTVFPENNSDYSTLYSTITADNNTKNKYNPVTAYVTNAGFHSELQTLYSNPTYYASNNAMSELGTTRFLALNYFIKSN